MNIVDKCNMRSMISNLLERDCYYLILRKNEKVKKEKRKTEKSFISTPTILILSN